MRKVLLLLSILSFATLARAQDTPLPDDTLRWSDSRPLALADFKGEAIESSKLMGEAFCLILYTLDNPEDSSYATISVQSVFDKSNSWISHSAKPEELLLFQVTFNIFEVAARKLRKEAHDLRSDPFAQAVFQRKYSSSLSALTYRCNELKRETKMGADKNKLTEWSQKIKAELSELDQFK